ncbi:MULTISPECIES: TonB-dependent receptor [unclassified Tenacibaculum]|uniref:TonB-dependent receptor n=1 Tax=unclassified Tenacibaculum TaxID=2635139 RepID=UPI001F461918|nr:MULTISPECIES: TonB-dependent receptor [unclassified Tenacibaculum]MCF2874228.1 TonB-dependent receptor [Tenacibaculum sp. Cn5-1]MCF2934809.1 TonB-dependent receptor [Tenacibaculum sp. Cn5-34]MCG7511019.1 TonB-dependent receptor [Tenacibaculum sp. Cn5-46]
MKKITLLIFTILFTSVTWAQTKITGTIKDTNNNPLPGANILEKGTPNGTSSDLDGNFSLTVKDGAILIISFSGFETKEVPVNGETSFNITLNEGLQLDEVIIVGSRNAKRTAVDTPVPVDIIDVQDLATKNGKVEVNDILQFAAPSFNATKQSGSDGADHIVPASLRGLGPDQTLVLINGKRRHQSSLVNIFGTRGRGNSGTDLNAIPAAAIKRIEVLRDGASAQYGSDAIAGVINIVLKDNTDGVTGSFGYGVYSTNVGSGWEAATGETLYNVNGKNRLDGKDKSFDGGTFKFDLNYGAKLNDRGGFVNFTTELLSKDRTLRPGFSWRKGYGSAAIDGFNFMVNSSLPINDNTEVYAFGGRNFRDTDAYAFSRSSFADGDNRSVPSLYPNGFTPRITSNITDISISAGIKHKLNNGWEVDFNNTYGENKFHYFIKDSNNASLKDASPTDFDAGGHSLSQNTTGINFTKYLENTLSGINLAFGIEYRTENFIIFSGEEASYGLYDNNGVLITNPATQTVATDSNGNDLPGGSQGFPGYSPDNEIDRSRSNVGMYFDSEFNFSEKFLVGAALRYEDYSDFGSTFNFKLASRFKASENLTFRGSISSGFRAPSLAQLYYNLKFTNIVNGQSLPSLLSANNSTVTRAFGIQQLKEEKAFNTSLGFTYKIGGFTATIDAYSITVDDRIILTDNFDASSLNLGVDAAQFFANGVDTKTQGLDIVLNYKKSFNDHKINIGLVGNFNDTKIKSINTPTTLQTTLGLSAEEAELTFFSPFSQAYLRASAPDHKFNLNLGYSYKKFDTNLTFTKFSEVQLYDFQWVDTPPKSQADVAALLDPAKGSVDTYESAITTDLSFSYAFTDKLKFTIGGNNIFNVYPTPQFDGWTDQGGLADSVQMGSDGAYFFARLGFKL